MALRIVSQKFINNHGALTFDPVEYLAKGGARRKVLEFPKRCIIFALGDLANSVFYLQKGQVRLSVVSKGGKEATIALQNAGDFFGEECVATVQPLRLATATALTDCAVLKIEKQEMLRVLCRERSFSAVFMAFLLARNVRLQSDLVDQLFNSSEKRLARALLLLARFGKEGRPDKVIAKVSQETLAEMVGTTRSRVSFFMNRFRKLGFIEYNGALTVHNSLLDVVLHD